MGRPVGSKNKPKGNTLKALLFDKQICGSPICKANGRGWVQWGLKNDYPNLLLDLYNQSPTHHACVNFAVQSIVGEGIDYEAMGIADSSQLVPNYSYSWDELLRSISLDFELYGSYAIQIILNNDGQTFSFWHMPLEKVRWSEYDEDGQITTYWISSDWTNTGRYTPFPIDAFDMREDTAIERGKPYLYVYRKYDPSLTYYTSPSYIAGIKAIQSEIEFVNFDLKTTVNSFVPSGMLVLNQVETDAERQEVIRQVQDLFQGSENANSVMIAFRSNLEDAIPSFVPFQASSENVNLFSESNTRTINRILSAHQVPNASLVGLPDLVGSGFASEADKLEVAYNLYQKLVGNFNRKCVVDTLNHMLAMNGIDTELILKPLTFLDEGTEAEQPQEEPQDGNVGESGNTEEQVVEE